MTSGRRQGFLPFETNAFDRVFISVMTGIFAFLLYFRFLEPSIPLWVPVVIWFAWLALVVRRG